MKRNSKTVTFAASTTSDAITLDSGEVVAGMLTPASLGVASLSILFSLDGVNYVDVYDSSNALITQTVDASASRMYDFTDSRFPMSLGKMMNLEKGFIKLKAPSNITAAINLICCL